MRTWFESSGSLAIDVGKDKHPQTRRLIVSVTTKNECMVLGECWSKCGPTSLVLIECGFRLKTIDTECFFEEKLFLFEKLLK